MAKYAQFLDFDELFPGLMEEDEFERLVPSAEAYVDRITHNRAQMAAGYKAERVRQAVCAAVREMAAQNATRSAGGARLQSVSNDGYTEVYGQGAATEDDEIRRVIRQWLSGTGLVSAL